MIRKILGILLVVAVVITIIVFISNRIDTARKEPPAIKDAPYQINTQGRVLYAKTAVKEGAVTVIRGYWETRNGYWKYNKEELRFPPEFGVVTIILRKPIHTGK